MQIKSIKETCLYFNDLAKAKSFYNKVLGLPIISEVLGKHIFFRAGSSVLLCFNPQDSKGKTSPPPHWSKGPYHFAFEVSDADYPDFKDHIISSEIDIIDEVVWSNGKESFYFTDPENNVCEIVPPGIWD